jgi:hypothetical protein
MRNKIVTCKQQVLASFAGSKLTKLRSKDWLQATSCQPLTFEVASQQLVCHTVRTC